MFLDRASMTRKHDPWKLRSLEMECFQEFFTKMGDTFSQWEFQDPKMEVPTIYIRPIFQAYASEYHHKI